MSEKRYRMHGIQDYLDGSVVYVDEFLLLDAREINAHIEKRFRESHPEIILEKNKKGLIAGKPN